MLLTPTYHVYDLYQAHQDATLVPLAIKSKDYSVGGEKLQAINASASQDKAGNITVSIVNIDPVNSIDLRFDMPGVQALNVSAQVITSEKFTDHNTFDQPGKVKPATFAGVKKSKESLSVKLPSKSIVMIRLSK
jgi:alpha-N-arabinofuranosidase